MVCGRAPLDDMMDPKAVFLERVLPAAAGEKGHFISRKAEDVGEIAADNSGTENENFHIICLCPHTGCACRREQILLSSME